MGGGGADRIVMAPAGAEAANPTNSASAGVTFISFLLGQAARPQNGFAPPIFN
jgi:hypothetical protein